ncbi:MAG TPA: hypothetical protein PKY77_15155 [Phycisphaerae bacterium]|nr:hypothetical protein [Phycisphaerae bacterium]HRY68322.1 hypothetical protein [Phycisphaerae bacterium]HSA26795.1 hypothetical protein [Phycisphaerae bacterium]
MVGRKAARTIVLAIAGVLWLVAPVLAAPYEEYWFFTHGYTSDLIHQAAGPDRLPMTADDVTVLLNPHGYLSIEIIDNDPASPGYTYAYHIRHDPCCLPTDKLDAGFMSLTTKSEPQFGILAEGETWTDNRRDDGGGVTGSGVPTDNNWDWEQNDSAATGPGWESASNYFWYNNAGANQRGLGGSKYYFEYKSPDLAPGQVFEEPEGYRHYNTLKLTTTGTTRKNIARDYKAMEIRGYLIPISEIHSLPHGSLHPLFGWQTVDMADWVRQNIGGMVDASGNPIGSFHAWSNMGGAYENAPPYKYVMVYQSDEPIEVSDPVNAALLEIQDGVSRSQRTYVMFKANTDSNPPLDIATPAQAGPVLVNSWGVEDMRRADYSLQGNLKTGADVGWSLTDDEYASDKRVVALPAGAAAVSAWVELPTLKLPARNLGVVMGKAVLRLDTGLVAGNALQIALVNGDEAVAVGSFKVGRPATVGVGGTVVGGPVTGSVGTAEPPSPDADGDQDVDGDDVLAFIGCYTGPTIHTIAGQCGDMDFDQDSDIDQVDFGVLQRCFSGTGVMFDTDCWPVAGTKFNPGSAYIELALWYNATAGTARLTVNGNEVTTYTAGTPTSPYVSGLYLWTSSAEILRVDTMALYTGGFTCSPTVGDLDGDGDADADDLAATHACYSGSGMPYRTGILPSCACLDKDGDFDVDEADDVTP